MPEIKSSTLSAIRGLSASDQKALHDVGVKTTRDLLSAAGTDAAERALAKKAGLSLTTIREAVNRADLLQLEGIGPVTADLFENAGVNSTRELAHRDPAHLASSIKAYAQSHGESYHHPPDEQTIAVLVQRAKDLYATSGVSTPDQAKDRAESALRAYVDDVLFSDDPAGASFRSNVLDGHPASERQAIHDQMLAELPAYLGRAPSPQHNSQLDELTQDATGYQLSGTWFGLHTEVHIQKDTGKADQLLVEID